MQCWRCVILSYFLFLGLFYVYRPDSRLFFLEINLPQFLDHAYPQFAMDSEFGSHLECWVAWLIATV